MKPFVLGAIFARGGSKGVWRKNVRQLCGKPLIAYAIETARAARGLDDVIVSTDDSEIADVARQYGAHVPFMRPAELAADNSPEILAWLHAMTEYEKVTGQKADVLVSVPATSPLRAPQDVERCLELLLNTDAGCVITVTPADRNPYYNMVKINAEGYASVVIDQGGTPSGRQKAPPVFDVTTVAYAVRAEHLKAGLGVLQGKVRAVEVPRERALDIDTLYDFELAEFFLSRRRAGAGQ